MFNIKISYVIHQLNQLNDKLGFLTDAHNSSQRLKDWYSDAQKKEDRALTISELTNLLQSFLPTLTFEAYQYFYYSYLRPRFKEALDERRFMLLQPRCNDKDWQQMYDENAKRVFSDCFMKFFHLSVTEINPLIDKSFYEQPYIEMINYLFKIGCLNEKTYQKICSIKVKDLTTLLKLMKLMQVYHHNIERNKYNFSDLVVNLLTVSKYAKNIEKNIELLHKNNTLSFEKLYSVILSMKNYIIRKRVLSILKKSNVSKSMLVNEVKQISYHLRQIQDYFTSNEGVNDEQEEESFQSYFYELRLNNTNLGTIMMVLDTLQVSDEINEASADFILKYFRKLQNLPKIFAPLKDKKLLSLKQIDKLAKKDADMNEVALAIVALDKAHCLNADSFNLICEHADNVKSITTCINHTNDMEIFDEKMLDEIAYRLSILKMPVDTVIAILILQNANIDSDENVELISRPRHKGSIEIAESLKDLSEKGYLDDKVRSFFVKYVEKIDQFFINKEERDDESDVYFNKLYSTIDVLVCFNLFNDKICSFLEKIDAKYLDDVALIYVVLNKKNLLTDDNIMKVNQYQSFASKVFKTTKKLYAFNLFNQPNFDLIYAHTQKLKKLIDILGDLKGDDMLSAERIVKLLDVIEYADVIAEALDIIEDGQLLCQVVFDSFCDHAPKACYFACLLYLLYRNCHEKIDELYLKLQIHEAFISEICVAFDVLGTLDGNEKANQAILENIIKDPVGAILEVGENNWWGVFEEYFSEFKKDFYEVRKAARVLSQGFRSPSSFFNSAGPDISKKIASYCQMDNSLNQKTADKIVQHSFSRPGKY